jgi:hypothetical protein
MSKTRVIDANSPSSARGRHGSKLLVDRRNAIAAAISRAESSGVDMAYPRPQGHDLSADGLSCSIAVIVELNVLESAIGVETKAALCPLFSERSLLTRCFAAHLVVNDSHLHRVTGKVEVH